MNQSRGNNSVGGGSPYSLGAVHDPIGARSQRCAVRLVLADPTHHIRRTAAAFTRSNDHA